MIEHKPEEPSNNYLHISSVSVVGLAIVGYLLYNKFKKPEQNSIDIPSPANASYANTEIKLRYFLKCIKKFLSYIYIHDS